MSNKTKKRNESWIIAYMKKICKEVVYFFRHYYFISILFVLGIFVCFKDFAVLKNKLVENLIFSYCGAFIFFLLVNYIPDRIKVLRCETEIIEKLELIYDSLSYIIELVRYELSKIERKEGEISGVVYSDIDKYANISSFNGDKYISNVKGAFYRIHSDLYKKCILIYENVDKIQMLPCFSYCEMEKIILLSKIKENYFLQRLMFFGNEYKIKKEYGIVKDEWFINDNKDERYLELIDLHSCLKKHVKRKSHYLFEEVSEKEVKKTKEFFEKIDKEYVDLRIIHMELNKKYQ